MRSLSKVPSASRYAGSVEALRIELAIRPEQEAAWKTFAAQLKICRKPAVSQFTSTLFGRPGLRSDLDNEFAILSARLEAIAAPQPALADFYAVLSQRQRMRADRLLCAHCGVIASDRLPARVHAHHVATAPMKSTSMKSERSGTIRSLAA